MNQSDTPGVGTFHNVIIVRQSTIAGMMVHVTNLTPPGSEGNPGCRREGHDAPGPRGGALHVESSLPIAHNL
jgi:hypothetical protein